MEIEPSPMSPFQVDDEDAEERAGCTSLTPGFSRISTATPVSATSFKAKANGGGGGGNNISNSSSVMMALEGTPPAPHQHQYKEGLQVKLRQLATDALAKRLHARASFYADKLVTLSQGRAPENVLLLAQTYHQGRDYRRAVHVLERFGLLAVRDAPEPLSRHQQRLLFTSAAAEAGGASSNSLEAYFLAAQCLAASDRYEKCLQLLEQVMPWGEEEDDEDEQGDEREGGGRGGASQSRHIQEIRAAILAAGRGGGGGGEDEAAATSMAPAASGGRQARRKDGGGNGNHKATHQAAADPAPSAQAQSVLSTLAAMCFLRAQVYESQDNRLRAVAWCRHALRLDVYCVEALEFLVDRKLLSQVEEKRLLAQELQFHYAHQQEEEEAPQGVDNEWLRLLYTTRLLCFQDAAGVPPALQHRALLQAFAQLDALGLGEDAVVLTSRAEMAFYYQQDAAGAHAMAKQVYTQDPFHEGCLPIYLCSLVELRLKTELYYCAHQLVEAHPKSAVAWFAVGCYYVTVRKNEAAQRYFHKAAKLDQRFAPAWIGFGNAFAAQDESDQAMSAYRTASRLFPSSHVPLLYIGMEYLRTNNLSLAQHFLQAAQDLNDVDPLLHNEAGVVLFRQGRYGEAALRFQHVLELCGAFSSRAMEGWEGTMVNLAHCHRKQGDFAAAISLYERAIGLAPRRASTYAALAFTHQLRGEFDKAVEYYHRALGLKADDAFASEMLSRALKDSLSLGVGGFGGPITSLSLVARSPGGQQEVGGGGGGGGGRRRSTASSAGSYEPMEEEEDSLDLSG